MPRRIAEDHENFRGILAGKGGKALKDAIKAGTIFNTRKTPINLQQMIGRAGRPPVESEATKKKKKYRSIEEPFEPSW